MKTHFSISFTTFLLFFTHSSAASRFLLLDDDSSSTQTATARLKIGGVLVINRTWRFWTFFFIYICFVSLFSPRLSLLLVEANITDPFQFQWKHFAHGSRRISQITRERNTIHNRQYSSHFEYFTRARDCLQNDWAVLTSYYLVRNVLYFLFTQANIPFSDIHTRKAV